jgi:hypothetical protein
MTGIRSKAVRLSNLGYKAVLECFPHSLIRFVLMKQGANSFSIVSAWDGYFIILRVLTVCAPLDERKIFPCSKCSWFGPELRFPSAE